MGFLQPALLLGILANAIPVIIHFWNQKKGKTIDWATIDWLIEKTPMSHRGVRLEDFWLLLLRCLLVVLFAAILAKPFFDGLNSDGATSAIHLVEPNKYLVEYNRFELEQAMKKGEKIYWLAQPIQEVKDLSILPTGFGNIQKAINEVSQKDDSLKLYIRNNTSLLNVSKIEVPTAFRLYNYNDTSYYGVEKYVELENGNALRVDSRTGELKNEGTVNNGQLVHKGPILVLIQFANKQEEQTIEAAVSALGNVYKLPFDIHFQRESGLGYDWILTDQKVDKINSQTLYMISGRSFLDVKPNNVIGIPDSLRIGTSELVRNGQLPEWFGEKLLAFYGLNSNNRPLSNAQLQALFERTDLQKHSYSEGFAQWLLLIFVIGVLAERIWSLQKMTKQTYA